MLFAHRATPQDQARAGFGMTFDWDVDLTCGYNHAFLDNVSKSPGLDHFGGCNTPAVRERLRAGRFDAVLIMGWHLKSYVQGLIAAKRLGLPVLVRGDSQLTTPRSSVKRLAKALGYPGLLRLFDVALYVGQRSRAYYGRFGYPEKRLFFSPHCVDATWFADRATPAARERLRHQIGVAENIKLILFAGKLISDKRPLDLILAASALRRRGRAVEGLIAGDGALKCDLENVARLAQVPVHFLGFRNQTEMPGAYAAADALALPSAATETWGLVANEALACGRPIIVLDACGCSDDLVGDGEDHRTGRVFPLGDVDAFANAIESVIDAPPAPANLSSMTSRYSIANAVCGVCEALASLGLAP